MSKSIIWLVIVIAAVGVAAGGHYYFNAREQAPAAPAVQPAPTEPLPLPAQKPAPDHGNFQKRFQPSMPGSK